MPGIRYRPNTQKITIGRTLFSGDHERQDHFLHHHALALYRRLRRPDVLPHVQRHQPAAVHRH